MGERDVTADVKKAGGALPEFTWGERNRLKMQHPFGRFLPGPLARLLDIKPFVLRQREELDASGVLEFIETLELATPKH